jgi:3-deoxy-manno-octulosonate cytidylyltransferase (CMP-KDO synthetase)
MKILGIIPARYQSTRFPGKPLIMIKGKPMIQRTWEQAGKVLDNVIVATDDERIRNAVKEFGGIAIMTSTAHKSGTERCAEAARLYRDDFDIVINIQGDEPFVHPEQIKQVAACFKNENVAIATLIKKIQTGDDLFNPNLPKVVVSKQGYAIYFSRSPIPYIMGRDKSGWIDSHNFFRHIGMYAFRREILQEISALEPSVLELAESLEQNRWLENGYRVKVEETPYDTIAIDTPDDLEKLI